MLLKDTTEFPMEDLIDKEVSREIKAGFGKMF